MEDTRNHDDQLNDDQTAVTPHEPAQPEAVPANDPANQAFHERLDASQGDFYDDDFIQSIDPEQNPYIDDQLNDENLQHEAESDYK